MSRTVRWLLGACILLPLPLYAQAGARASRLILPVGTQVTMALTRPVWMAKVKAGDTLYCQTVFPAAVQGATAIPAGTFVSAQIDSVHKPTRKLQQATLRIHFTSIDFAGGYTVVFGSPGYVALAEALGRPVDLRAQKERQPTPTLVTIKVTTGNDLLLDNGTQIALTLTQPLSLNAARAAASLPLSTAPNLSAFQPATLCRDTPFVAGSPATPDTVIPGNPGSPGTPDTVIPSGDPGVPDTVIPGIPATPATPDTVIPGTPGTPDTPAFTCPDPPFVVSSLPVIHAAAATSPATHP